MKLYDYFRSSASFRVRIALSLKKVPYEAIPVQLNGEQHHPGYLNINPQGMVPTLETGDHHLTQSLAIIEYLEEMHPAPSLLPRHPREKALARAFAHTIASDIQPLTSLRVTDLLKNDYQFNENQILAWTSRWIQAGLESLEKQIRMQALAGDFCYGNQPSIADICLIPQLYHARRFNCQLQGLTQLTRIESNCQKHPAFMQAWPLENIT